MRKKTGFTLIELLVVISIIALLIAILMPALNTARDQAKAVSCQSNLKQMTLGVVYYAHDNDDTLFAVIDIKIDGAGEYWHHSIARYFGDKNYVTEPGKEAGVMEVMFCPSTKRTGRPTVVNGAWDAWPGTAKLAWGFMGGEGCYGMNMWLTPRGDWSTPPNPPDKPEGMPAEDQDKFFRKYSQAKSSVPVFADSMWVGAWPYSYDSTTTAIPPDFSGVLSWSDFPHDADYFMHRFLLDRHKMAINSSFADGHVERVELHNLWTLNWNKGYRPTSDVGF
jgi:prepilin-type N-terminal cleavage/methylation domain-containing protein/prepilin-type processing-associated H-X9-DG protein